MKLKEILLCIFALALLTFCRQGDRPSRAPVRMVTDLYYGVEVNDPYRYMESMDDTVFLNWMRQYSGYTRSVLDGIPGRDKLVEQMRIFDSRSEARIYGLNIQGENRYFYLKIQPEDETGKLYYRDGYEGKEILLFSPDEYMPESDLSYVISGICPSVEGDLVGINLSPNGSETNTMLVMEVATGKFLGDKIEHIMGSCSWLPEGRGFIYTKSNTDDVHDPERFIDMKVYYHVTGTSQARDRVIFSKELAEGVSKRPEEIPFVIYDHFENEMSLLLYTVERYIKLYHAKGNPETNRQISWKRLIGAGDQVQRYYIKGDDLYLYTARNASNFKILKTSKFNVDIPGAEVVVPEPDDAMISGFSFTDEAIYLTYKYNGIEERLFRKQYGSTIVEPVELPASAGTVKILSRGHHYSDLWVYLTGWTMDAVRYRVNPENLSFREEPLSSKAEFPEYKTLTTEQIMVESHDGTKVPLSVIYREGTAMDGSAPLIMTGYGAYGVSRVPGFNPFTLMWTMHGGIIAISHVRGGGELGDAWRLAGHKTTKPNTWKDFIACAEFLIREGYTSEEHLAIYGGSAGGVLIGRSMTERPDLFAAAVPMVGLMNPLRMEESPNGPANAPEFGTVEDSVECMALIEMDAYLHIEDGVGYPATLVTAGFNDPRVIVWQPAKFAARLQAAQGSKAPVLFDVDYRSGHGSGDTKTKSFNDLADLYAFCLWQTGHPDFQYD